MESNRRKVQELLQSKEDNNQTWDERFLDIAREVSTWSTCTRPEKHNGAIIVSDNKILSTGCNGAPENVKSCRDRGYCIRKKLGIESGTRFEVCYALHAEQNALLQAARYGISLEDATLYVLRKPCINCFKMLINSGIKRIVYKEENFDNEVYDDIADQCKIEFKKISTQKEED
jgi:dCMP deaminase